MQLIEWTWIGTYNSIRLLTPVAQFDNDMIRTLINRMLNADLGSEPDYHWTRGPAGEYHVNDVNCKPLGALYHEIVTVGQLY